MKETLNCYQTKKTISYNGETGFTSPSISGLLEIIRSFNSQDGHYEQLCLKPMRFDGYVDINQLYDDFDPKSKYEVMEDAI